MRRRAADPHLAGIALRVSAAAVVLVWFLVSVGGMLNPGFKQYEQYLSALGADGAVTPGWGRAALAVTGLAIAVLVPALVSWRTLIGASASIAALAAMAMSQLPMSCPAAARFCGSTSGGLDVAHSMAVLTFAVAVMVLLLAGVRQVMAGSGAAPRLWPMVPTAIILVALSAPLLLTVSGLLQRLILLTAQVLVLGVGAAAAAELQRRERQYEKVRVLTSSSP